MIVFIGNIFAVSKIPVDIQIFVYAEIDVVGNDKNLSHLNSPLNFLDKLFEGISFRDRGLNQSLSHCYTKKIEFGHYGYKFKGRI